MNSLAISTATLALAALAVQGCSRPEPPPAASGARIYAYDVNGKAPVCAVPVLAPVDGKENTAAMTDGGGGWCGIVLHTGRGAYSAGLLTQPAQNGKVYVHTVGDDTRVDYIAKPGAVMPDTFTVRMIPGDAVIKVSVSPPPAATAPSK